MSKAGIPEDIKQEINNAVTQFNSGIKNAAVDYYTVRFRGRFAYLDHCRFGRASPVCRLEYQGGMKNWGFAIYKYSSDAYDPEEFLFPGAQHLNGTVEGALKAVREAYP